MTFDDVGAFVDELDRFDTQRFEAEADRTEMLVKFAGQLVGAQTKVLAAALGARVV